MINNNKTAFIFPGQGAQYPGIGKDLHAQNKIVQQTYQEASDVLGYDMSTLSFDDPEQKINFTKFTQPVLLTHSIACNRAFNALLNEPLEANILAGHSLGEYSALVCAGALTFETALLLVKTRGELMGKYGEGEMEALMLDYEASKALAEQHYCAIAVCNLPEQNVVGGRAEDLDALITTMSHRHPRKRSARLKTEGAFHTYYMIEAAKQFRETLNQTNFSLPTVDALSNYSGDTHQADIEMIKSSLFLQLFNPVLWYQNLRTVITTVETIIEFGGGLGKGESAAEKQPNLSGIVKKASREIESPPYYLSVINQQTLEESVAHFNAD